MNINDNEIICHILSGNTNAFHLLVDKYKNMVFSLVYNIVLNREDAEEIAQDTFVKAFKGLTNFKGESQFSTWLYKIAANTSFNKKKLKVYPAKPIDSYIEVEQYDSVFVLLEKYENSDRKKIVQTVLQHLKEDERICITLFYLNELQVNEIYQITGISTANIKVLLYRGRKNLYAQLEKELKSEINNLL